MPTMRSGPGPSPRGAPIIRQPARWRHSQDPTLYRVWTEVVVKHSVELTRVGVMKAVLGLLITFLVVNLGVIASGVGIGLLLHWVLPSVDLGEGILIGIVSTALSIHYFGRILALGKVRDFPDGDDDDFGAPIIIYPQSPSRSGRKRKR